MKLLLDTHTFMWWDSDKSKLSPTALEACESPENTLYLSLASVWEMQIKHQLGKLALGQPLADLLRKHEDINRTTILPVALADIIALSELPPIHRDPFDRILIAQTRRGGFRFVTCDPTIASYEVDVLW